MADCVGNHPAETRERQERAVQPECPRAQRERRFYILESRHIFHLLGSTSVIAVIDYSKLGFERQINARGCQEGIKPNLRGRAGRNSDSRSGMRAPGEE